MFRLITFVPAASNKMPDVLLFSDFDELIQKVEFTVAKRPEGGTYLCEPFLGQYMLYMHDVKAGTVLACGYTDYPLPNHLEDISSVVSNFSKEAPKKE